MRWWRIVTITIIFCLGFATAQAAGLTVKPSSLRVSVPWGGTAQTQVLVSNTTDAPAMYQAAVEPVSAGTVAPDGFRLQPGESQLLTVNARGRLRPRSATVAVAALPLDTRGVAVGSGVRVPLQVRVLLPWWAVSLSWVLPLLVLAVGWRLTRRRRAGSLPPWAAATLAAIAIASVGLTGLLVVADWPVRPAAPPPTAVGPSRPWTMTVDFGNGQPRSYSEPATGAATAYSLLQAVAQREQMPVEGRDYGQLGVLVTGINGVRNDPRARTYWYWWVNGQFGRVSASRYPLQPGDRLAWRYVSELKPE